MIVTVMQEKQTVLDIIDFVRYVLPMKMVLDFAQAIAEKDRLQSDADALRVRQVIEADLDEFVVRNPVSDSHYSVVRVNGYWRCGCKFHEKKRRECKHIIAAKDYCRRNGI